MVVDVPHTVLRIEPVRLAQGAAAPRGRRQLNPVTPWRTTSGTAPRLSATTGVPVAMASTMTMPKGSSHCNGMIRQRAVSSSSRNSVPGRR